MKDVTQVNREGRQDADAGVSKVLYLILQENTGSLLGLDALMQ